MLLDLTAVLSAASLIERQWNKQERLALQNALRSALPRHRAAACLRHRLGESEVTVSATRDGGTRLGGLMVCQAFHVCPVCHHKKLAEDQATFAQIVADHYAAGGFMVDAVFTVPHRAGEPLSVVLERLEGVWRRLRSKSIWRELTDELGVVGCVRRLEVTLTEHGWHPHYHVSLLCDWALATGITSSSREGALTETHALVAGCWARAGKKAGVTVSLWAQAAVTIVAAVDAQKAVEYSTKNMGLGGKYDSLTPMDLLRIIDQCGDPLIERAAKRLFNEYADAIKGKHVLSCLGTARITKAAIDATPTPPKDDQAEQLGRVSVDGWAAVLKAGLREEIAGVTTRADLAECVLRAASFMGHRTIPAGWLVLSPAIKTVIGVKAVPPACL